MVSFFNSINVSTKIKIFISTISTACIATPFYGDIFRYLITMVIVFGLLISTEYYGLRILFGGGKRILQKAILFLLMGYGLLVTLQFISIAANARMYADDFCYYMYTIDNSVFKAGLDFYFNWSGRFFSNFLLFFASGFPLISLIQVLLSFVSIFLSAQIFNNDKLLKNIAWKLTAALLIPPLVYNLSPDIYKSLMWLVASVICFPFLVLFPIDLSLIRKYLSHKKPNKVMPFIFFMLSFAISTTHEVATLPVLLINFLLAIFLLKKWRQLSNIHRITFLSSILGSILGLVVTVFSPGNYSRHDAQAYPDFTFHLKDFLMTNTAFTFHFIKRTIFADWNWILLFTGFVFGILFPFKFKQEKREKISLLILFSTLIMVWLCPL
ncbi:MAG: hypothetical protein JEZ03_17965 [Bacteroidales bacterium]|nr:hypothetical protein [Bacteroidales bacterium]